METHSIIREVKYREYASGDAMPLADPVPNPAPVDVLGKVKAILVEFS